VSPLAQSVDRLMAPPPVQGTTGFTATTVVAPGTVSDPLVLVPRGEGAWLNDGGGEDGERGGEILAVTGDGQVSRVFDTGRTRPTASMAVAPEGYGALGGQLFTVSQPRDGALGPQGDHAVLRWPTLVAVAPLRACVLPTRGAADASVPGGGYALRFGPETGPFANRLFVAAAPLGAIYEVLPQGECRVFLALGETGWTHPLALGFSASGERLLVGVVRAAGAAPAESPRAGRVAAAPVPTGPGGPGAILQVTPAGTIDPVPVAVGLEPVWAMARAPATFGPHGDELFVTAGDPPRDLMGQVGNGKLYRITREGALEVVASGFLRPTGAAFVGGALWVADAKGRRVPGQRIPDGMVIRIVPDRLTGGGPEGD